MMNAKKLDLWSTILVGLANYHGKPLPKRKTLQSGLTQSFGFEGFPVAGKPKKLGGKAATARPNVARWCVGTRKRIAWSYPLFWRSIFAMDRRSLRKRKTRRHIRVISGETYFV
jgi:hypothetical protein